MNRLGRVKACLGTVVFGMGLMADEAPAFEHGHWVDLSHAFSSDTLFWPTEEGFVLETEFKGFTPGGYFYMSNRYRSAEHGGTHLDSPIHFAEGRKTVDQLPLRQLCGRAVVVDVKGQADGDRDYQVGVEDLKTWEKAHGRIPKGAMVLIRTGFSERWPNAGAYLGTAEKGPAAVAKLHFPGLHPVAAKWLAEEREIRALGIDTASIDFGQSKLFETHRILLGKNIPAFENVTALGQLPATGAYVVAMPMKIQGGSGAPLRIAAWVADGVEAKGRAGVRTPASGGIMDPRGERAAAGRGRPGPR